MLRTSLAFIVLLSQLACGGGQSGSDSESAITFPPAGGANATLTNRTTGAYTFPVPTLTADEAQRHIVGDAIFDSQFKDQKGFPLSGLGPLFNNVGCRSCHQKNGRGLPIMGDTGGFKSDILTRVSLDPDKLADFPGSVPSPGDGPIPVPGIGGQLQDFSIYGVEPEAHVALTWEDVPGAFDDGTPYTLRRPQVKFTGQYADLLQNPAVLTSLRQTPPIFGLGLLEAVPDETLKSFEDPTDKNGDGIKGHLNHVWNPATGTVAIGRFGWKASAPTLLAQTAAAFAEDMGVTNPLHPEADGTSDITAQTLSDAAFYASSLAVPARLDSTDPAVQRGAKLFRGLGCESCHKSDLVTGNDYPIASLRNQHFSPFTDLLLHDMGEGLADHRPDFQATGSEWRTPPLWGLGLVQTVQPNAAFLHDGRARTIEEAILWHDGEAANAQKGYKKLPASMRSDLQAFLKSL